MLPLWIDTDACHDDALALLLAGALPCFDLLGVSTTYGSVSLECATRNTHSLLTALQATDVHVYPGEEKPSMGLLPPQNGKTGLRGSGLLPLPLGPRQPDHSAVSALCTAIQQTPPQQITIACLGSLTNIAAFAVNNPSLVPLVGTISISAGVDDCNLKADAYATEIVLNLGEVIKQHVPPGSRLPQIVVAHTPILTPKNDSSSNLHLPVKLDPQTHRDVLLLTPETLQDIKKGPNSNKYTVFRQMLYELLTYYADNVTNVLCDPLAVMALIPQEMHTDAGIFVTETGDVTVSNPEQLWKLVHESIEALESDA